MASELIDNVIDVAKVKAEYDEIFEYNEKLKKDISSFAGDVKKLMDATRAAKTGDDLAKSSKELNDSIVKGNKIIEQKTAVEKELEKQEKTLEQIEAKRYAVSSQNNKEIEANKKLLAEQTELLKLNTQLQNENLGKIERATIENKKLQIQKTKLLETDAEYEKKLNEINEQQDKNYEIIKLGQNTIQKQKDNVGNYEESIKNAIKSLLNEANAQKENIKIWFKGWLDSLKTSFDNGKKLITGKLDGWWGSIKGWFSGLGKKKEIKDAGKNMINKVSEGNSAKKKDFMDKLGKLIVDVIVGAGKLAFIAAIAAGREIIKRIIDGVNNKIPALKAKISSVLGYITKPIANLSKTLYNSGRNLISNLISGITSKFGDLKNTVMKGAGIIGNFLGFESPTKEGPGKESDKWMPNLMRMLSETLLSKRSLLKDSVQKIAGDLIFNDVSANIGVKSSLGNGALAGAKGNIILNINNPQMFDRRGIQQVASDIKTELQSYMNFKKG